jgi:hypothetical protein
MRRAAVALILLMPGCGWVEAERQKAADAARAETLAEVEDILADAVRRADRLAARGDRILSPMPVMTPAEEDRLRRHRSAVHVAEASTLGIRARDEAQLDSLVAAGRLVELADSTEFWIVRRRTDARVVPEMQALLETLGARFHERLDELNLPRYRMEVTSAMRTAERQAELRRTNANAASGVSSHEFGATVDLSYAAFAPPAETPPTVPENAPADFHPHLERITDLALESLSARKSRELGRVFSQVLEEAQAEGSALVIYERQQTVYHVTARRQDGA